MSKRINVISFSELCVSACTVEEVCTCQEIDLDGFTVTQSQELPEETSYSVLLSFSHDVLIESVGVSPHGNVASCSANNQTSERVVLSCSDLSNSTTYFVTAQGKASLNNSESGYQYLEFAVSLDFSTAAHMNNETVDESGLSDGAITGIVISIIFLLSIVIVTVQIILVFKLARYRIKHSTTKGFIDEAFFANSTRGISCEGALGEQLFLSYTHEPGIDDFVGKLKQDLEQSGFTVLMDMDIPAGSDCVGQNRSAVYNCKGFIAIITNNYLKSDTCIEKLHLANSSKKKIFPVTREDVNYAQSEKALGVKSVIQNINWVYFRQDLANYSQSLAHLVSRVTASGIEPGGAEATDTDHDESICAVGSHIPDGEKQLFLSYEHEPDVDDFVWRLKQDLEQSGFTVLMDVDIPAGSGRGDHVRSAVDNCKGLIAVITNSYVNSNTCTEELDMAHSRSKRIFPVILEKPPEDAVKINAVIQGINWVYFHPNMDNQEYSHSLAQLVSRVNASGIEPVAVKATVASPDESPCDAGKQLFLSYEHDPGIDEYVWQVKQYLERRGFTVWMGVVFPARTSSTKGTFWVKLMKSAISNCEGFIAIITDNYIKSDHRPIELNEAHSRKMKIFPVIHKEVNHDTHPDEEFWRKFVIERVDFLPDAPNSNHSQSLALLEYRVTANGIQPAALAALEATDFDPDESQEGESKIEDTKV